MFLRCHLILRAYFTSMQALLQVGLNKVLTEAFINTALQRSCMQVCGMYLDA